MWLSFFWLSCIMVLCLCYVYWWAPVLLLDFVLLIESCLFSMLPLNKMFGAYVTDVDCVFTLITLLQWEVIPFTIWLLMCPLMPSLVFLLHSMLGRPYELIEHSANQCSVIGRYLSACVGVICFSFRGFGVWIFVNDVTVFVVNNALSPVIDVSVSFSVYQA